jgi:hypothetical protein
MLKKSSSYWGFALEEMDRLDPSNFKKMFRVDRLTIEEIVGKITQFLSHRNATKAKNSSGSEISVTTRLAVTLCWLAGASYLDLYFACVISSSSFFSRRGVLWPTINAIDKALVLGFPVNDSERLEQIANGFRQNSEGDLDGCVLALDGLGVLVPCPFLR